ncbi:PHO85 cyclin-1, partial [Coemansia sp. RSA 2320]
MSTQVDRGHSAQRPTHLNMTTPLSTRTLEAIQCEITKEMIAIIATHAKGVIPCTPASSIAPTSSGSTHLQTSQEARQGASERLPSPPTTPGSNAMSSIPPLDMFITNLVLRSRVQAGTLICTLVYLRRLRHRLPKEARGMECTCHRIFLATLIVAGKYLNDASPKNKYWARYSTVFTVAEVNLMEKQLLFLLDFDLRIDNDDLNDAASPFFVVESNLSIPLTPTTPPLGATSCRPAIPATNCSARRTEERAYLESVPVSSMDSHSVSHQLHKSYLQRESAKAYPSTLGLNGHNRSIQPPVATLGPSVADRSDVDNIAVEPLESNMPLSAALKQTPQPGGLAKRQLQPEPAQSLRSATATPVSIAGLRSKHSMLQHKSSLPFDSLSDAKYKTPTGPVHQITVDDMAPLRPSPKKRAVSRGHHGNVPHPSPIYHCSTAGTQSSAVTATASALTASSACFLQPLEQASINYASSKYQQQRYDPNASRGYRGDCDRSVPRMAT